MCTCNKEQQDTTVNRKNSYRIWELQEGYLCSVIGTCLSVEELKKLSRKTELTLDSSLSAYEIHVLFVDASQEASSDSRVVNKYLNKKYSLSINQAKRIKTSEELGDFWQYSKDQNRLAGGYWAILTHPLAKPSFCHKLHGEIHMLSHLATKKSNTTGKRLKDQKNKLEVLHETLHLAKTQAQLEVAWRDEEINDLKLQVLANKSQSARLKNALQKISQLESGQNIKELQQTNSKLTSRLQEEQETSTLQTETLHKTTAEHYELNEKHNQLHGKFQELKQENNAMEQMLREQNPCPTCQNGGNCTDCPNLDLCGRCVLYVGGQHSLVPHYRQIVEDCGGTFMHHDGGKEDQRVKLGKMLSRADAVICPINCVSHDACLRAKKLCKSQTKPFIPMRSAGLSSLARGLEIVADKATQ